MRIAVAGATGVVGTHVVEQARAAGHDVVPLARSLGVDLTTGEGLPGRLDNVQAVVDTTSVRSQSRRAAERFFGDVTRTLLRAEADAGVGHHVVLSIVGIDDVPSGYYQGKLLQERLAASGPVPWTVLRATQFHEFAEQVLAFASAGPFSLVPRMLSQPVAAVEVARALVDAVEAGPGGRVADLGGPERHEMVDLARRVSAARGGRRRVVPVPLPGATGRGMRSGALCLSDGGRHGRQTFEEWLGS